MPSRPHFAPMEAISTAIRMFMEECPEDALRVLHYAQQQYFDCLQHERLTDFAEDLKEDQKQQSAKHDPKPMMLRVTNHLHSAQAYPERHQAEARVQELRNETGWDWTYISVEDETGDCWHHMPCICSGGSYVYLA